MVASDVLVCDQPCGQLSADHSGRAQDQDVPTSTVVGVVDADHPDFAGLVHGLPVRNRRRSGSPPAVPASRPPYSRRLVDQVQTRSAGRAHDRSGLPAPPYGIRDPQRVSAWRLRRLMPAPERATRAAISGLSAGAPGGDHRGTPAAKLARTPPQPPLVTKTEAFGE